MAKIPNELRALADESRRVGEPVKVTPRRLLEYFGAQRRGNQVVWSIREALNELAVATSPDFEHAYVDGEIFLGPIKRPLADKNEESPGSSDVHNDEETIHVSNESAGDRVPRIHMLPAANQKPVSINRDAPLRDAVTLMLLHDYSQLPVMPNDHSVQGLISWKSVGNVQALGRRCEFVRDCMDTEVAILKADFPLVSALDLIAKREVVLVRSRQQVITGIVTTADVSLQFKELAEPFLLIGDIENHLRHLIETKFSMESLRASQCGDSIAREVGKVEDLTIGSFVKLLENPKNWDQLGWTISREEFVKKLNKVRESRNAVMHFRDQIEPLEINLLRDMVRLLQSIRIAEQEKITVSQPRRNAV